MPYPSISKLTRSTGSPWLPCGLVLLSCLGGCQVLPRSATPSGPFIVPTAEEATQVANFARELDAMLSQCATPSSCD